MRTIIIDDEPNATSMLQLELAQQFPEVEVVGIYNDAKKALKALDNDSCDLLLLDVEMPHLDGFELLSRFPKRQFDVVFTTAYSEYAIKAIKERAMDYLLKPIDSEELKIAVEKVMKKREGNQSEIVDILSRIDDHEKDIIKVPTSKGLSFVEAKEIIYCKAESNYVNIITTDQNFFISKTLKHMQELLPSKLFIRCHLSFIVNQRHIREYIRTDGGYFIMSNGDRVNVSSNKKEIFSI